MCGRRTTRGRSRSRTDLAPEPPQRTFTTTKPTPPIGAPTLRSPPLPLILPLILCPPGEDPPNHPPPRPPRGLPRRGPEAAPRNDMLLCGATQTMSSRGGGGRRPRPTRRSPGRVRAVLPSSAGAERTQGQGQLAASGGRDRRRATQTLSSRGGGGRRPRPTRRSPGRVRAVLPSSAGAGRTLLRDACPCP